MKPESLARLAELAGCSASEFITQLLPEQASRVGRATFEGASTLWLPVQLPSEDVLHEMFLALLEPLKTEKSQDVIARRLLSCCQVRFHRAYLGSHDIAPFQRGRKEAQQARQFSRQIVHGSRR